MFQLNLKICSETKKETFIKRRIEPFNTEIIIKVE